MNFRIKLAYDGTDFTGWQMQAGSRTVQGLLTDALTTIDGSPVSVHGAGRTDAGVHAEGQVASFFLSRERTGPELERALNGSLPYDIRVIEASVVPDDFHARRNAKSKTYRYHLFNAQVMNPLLHRYAWYYPYSLDLDRLESDQRQLLGEHDFSAFTVASCEVESRVRTLLDARLTRSGSSVFLTFTGDGFLRYMVRTMVGALLNANRGRLKIPSIKELLEGGDRQLAGRMAPAKGLTMMKVGY